MQLLLSLVLFVSLTYNALALPNSPQYQRQTRSFKVERVRAGDYVADGPTALRKALRKFGFTPTNVTGANFYGPKTNNLSASGAASSDRGSQNIDQEGSVTATSIHGDREFVSPVTIGGQTITMNLDTGSSDIWVMNTQMKPSMTKGHTLYDPRNSSTYKPIMNGEFSITYGDGSWANGDLGSDTVSIGGATVQQQTFGLALNVSDAFISDTHSNGLVGLGFTPRSRSDNRSQRTFFENLAPTLDEPVLTARLRSDGVGEYEFGTIDQSKYTGPLANISVNSANGYWQIDTPVYGLQVGDWNVTLEDPDATAIVDTGTSLILADEAVVAMYYLIIPGAFFSEPIQAYVFPCDAELPDFFIMLSYGYKVPVPGWVLNYAAVDIASTAPVQYCYGGLQSNQGSNMQILGDVFLKAFFVVFDHRGPSLGLATPA